jgi:hypothetical protein
VDELPAHRRVWPQLAGLPDFQAAKRLCQWHYQWLIVNDYLPEVVQRSTINAIRTFEHGRFRITTTRRPRRSATT